MCQSGGLPVTEEGLWMWIKLLPVGPQCWLQRGQHRQHQRQFQLAGELHRLQFQKAVARLVAEGNQRNRGNRGNLGSLRSRLQGSQGIQESRLQGAMHVSAKCAGEGQGVQSRKIAYLSGHNVGSNFSGISGNIGSSINSSSCWLGSYIACSFRSLWRGWWLRETRETGETGETWEA